MSKDVLIALIAKDVRELEVMTEGMDKMNEIPSQYLVLAHKKSIELTSNLDNLIKSLKDEEAIKAKEEKEQAAETKRKEEEAERKRQEALKEQEEEQRKKEEEEAREKAAEELRKQEAARAAKEQEIAEQQRAAEEERRQREEREQQAREAAEKKRLEEERAEAAKQAEEERRIAEENKKAAEVEKEAQEIEIIKSAAPETTKTTFAESIKTSESILDKLSKKEDTTLASALNNHKISDLKASISVIDRFRYQRELFAGNGEKMNKAIADFNSFATMEEAMRYIQQHFNWNEENGAVADFLQLLHRRYL